MKSVQLNQDTRDASGALTVVIILILGFVCFGMTGLSYGENRPAINVRVADMQVSMVPGSSGKLTQVAITITDKSGNPVIGATVEGEFSGLLKSYVSGVTGTNGTISFQTNQKGAFTFMVTDVSSSWFHYTLVQSMVADISVFEDDPGKQNLGPGLPLLPGAMGVASLTPASTPADSQLRQSTVMRWR